MSGEVDLYTFITSDPRNATKFEEYLVQEGWSHQYDFVCVVQELDTLESEPLNLARAIREIHRTYLNLVSVSDRVKLTVDHKITFQEYSTDIFDEAVREVWDFLSSVVYKQFLVHVKTSSNDDDNDSVISETTTDPGQANDLVTDRRREAQQQFLSCDSNSVKSESSCPSQVNNNNWYHVTRPDSDGQNLAAGGIPDIDLLSLSSKPTVQNQRSTAAATLTEGPIVVTRKYLINRDRDSLPEKKPPPRQSPIELQKLTTTDFARKLEDMQGKREFVKGLNKTLKEKLGDKSHLDEPDDILDEHVKIVWAGDVTPEKSTSPPTRRDHRRREGYANNNNSGVCPCPGTRGNHHNLRQKYPDPQFLVPRSQTFPSPSTSKCDPDSGISVLSMSTSTSASVRSHPQDKMGYTSKWLNNNNNKFSSGHSPPQLNAAKWKKDKVGIPVVVHCHGNPVPFYFVIPTTTSTTTNNNNQIITLRMFKEYLPMKDNYRYLFQYSGRKGVGMEEIFEDASQIPIFNGQIVARIRPFF